MGQNTLPPDGGDDNIVPVDLKAALEERYLAYALSTIMHRALPDVRDGLKPVHRRIMHAMRELRLNPDQAYAKCARIVGDVMGKFHPHGDASIYDALVRLAQDFSQCVIRSSTGRATSAISTAITPPPMRYTEARMTEVATLLLDGIDRKRHRLPPDL
jgi:topoisomerase-4 subunit A